IQCFKCLRYGHSKNLCKNKLRCPRCLEEHELKDCTNKEVLPVCLHCKGAHLSNEQDRSFRDRICPEFQRQQQIRQLMSVHNVSYYEASRATPNINNENSYSFHTQAQHMQFPPLK